MSLHPPLDAALEARLSRLPKAELHFHFEGAFRWSTIREFHPDGNALPEREPWLNCARPFAEFPTVCAPLKTRLWCVHWHAPGCACTSARRATSCLLWRAIMRRIRCACYVMPACAVPSTPTT